ncbi:MAG: hypothetical protein OEQ29_02520 [Alphaproteobacteria bacterium]|nr:hypothetical protein [Alphaproteobacteria bacterium]
MNIEVAPAAAGARPRLLAALGWRELFSPRYLAGAATHVARLIRRDPVPRAILVTLLAIDATLMLLHWYRELGLDSTYPIAFLDVAKLNMIRHDSYVTSVDLVKSAATAAFLVVAWIATRAVAYLSIGLAYAIVIVFGTTVFHVDLGVRIARYTGLANLYPEMGDHMAEGVVLAIIGAVLLLLIALGVVRSRGIHSVFAVAMAVAIVALGFFAGGMDLFHALIFFELQDYVHILAFVEEAGEALAQTTGCVFAVAIARRCAGRRP